MANCPTIKGKGKGGGKGKTKTKGKGANEVSENQDETQEEYDDEGNFDVDNHGFGATGINEVVWKTVASRGHRSNRATVDQTAAHQPAPRRRWGNPVTTSNPFEVLQPLDSEDYPPLTKEGNHQQRASEKPNQEQKRTTKATSGKVRMPRLRRGVTQRNRGKPAEAKPSEQEQPLEQPLDNRGISTTSGQPLQNNLQNNPQNDFQDNLQNNPWTTFRKTSNFR